jgi:uncharacterized membrane protein
VARAAGGVALSRRLLWAAIVGYTAGFAWLSVLRHRAFSTGRFDLGNMVQAVWSTAHGHPFRATSLEGEQISRLAAHVDPVLALFAPLWWLWPSPDLLVSAQAAAIALGAIPVFRLARRTLDSSRAALCFALAYLLYPATQWLTLNEFHPVALACPLLLLAIDLLDEDRVAAAVPVLALAALTKEEVGLVVAGLGVWYAFNRGRRAAGGAIALAGFVWSAVAVWAIIPHFNHGESSFFGRYDDVGGSPSGMVGTAFTDPLQLVRVAFDHQGVHYLLDLLLPLGALSLLAPILLVAALPELALNLLSSAPTQSSIHFHYTAAEIPVLVAAAIYGAARLSFRKTTVAGAVLVVALSANWRLGAIPLWREVPGGETLQSRDHVVTEHDRVAARALRMIPDGVAVSASNSLGAHLSARSRILSFPYLQDAAWIAADETNPGYADRLAPQATAVQLAWLRRNPAWRLVFEEDGVLVFRRVLPP